MPRRLSALLLVFLFAWLVLPAGVAAQTAIIYGVIRDIEGNPIGGATVNAQDVRFIRTEQTTSNDAGRFAFIGLSPGRWLFVIQAVGFQPVQGLANIRRAGNSGRIEFVMEGDPFNQPAPDWGQLAGILGKQIQADLDAADLLFDSGYYDGAIAAYEALLERVPQLTSLNLQIGHAHLQQQNFDNALAAYRAIPSDDPSGPEAQAAIEALDLAQNAR